ncbi:hypothetical protein SK128_003262, partial [Halocaridina rubra]
MNVFFSSLKSWPGSRSKQELKGKSDIISLDESDLVTTGDINPEGEMRWWQRDLCPLLSFPGENIDIASTRLREGRSYIFLTETMCRTALLPRQACAAESLATHNPERIVVFLMTSQRLNAKDPYTQLLFKFSFMELDEYFGNTSLEKWFLNGTWNENTNWPYMNLADALRFLIVYHFGGVYMDSDFVSMRRLPIASNWVGRQDNKVLAAGAFHFEKNHEFMRRAVDNFLENFNPNIWSNNGPGVVTRVMKQMCKESVEEFYLIKANKKSKGRHRVCGGVKILPPELIYPIHFSDWKLLFQPNLGYRFLSKCDAYGVHMWNKLSEAEETHVGDGSISDITAKKFCPEV